LSFKKGKNKMKDLDKEFAKSDSLISVYSEDDGERSPRRVKRRYPKWKELSDFKEKVELIVGLKPPPPV
jgi:hypothetical protein